MPLHSRIASSSDQAPFGSKVMRACGQRGDGFDFPFAREYAALEFEILEAIVRIGGFGETHDRWRRQRLVMAQAKPIDVGIRLGAIGQVGLVAVADEKQIAEHLDRGALLAFAKQGRDRHVEKLPDEIEQRRLDRGDSMDRYALIESL